MKEKDNPQYYIDSASKNEVLKDSVSTRLYTDDAKYDIYQIKMI